MDPFHVLLRPFREVPPPPNEVNRRYEKEVAVVHAALVELGVAVPSDMTEAKVVVKLNRLCNRSGAEFEGVLRALSTLCNDAPLLIDRLTPAAKATVEAGLRDEDDEP